MSRGDNRIVFRERINGATHRDYMKVLSDALEVAGTGSAQSELVLDFTDITRAQPAGMVPILCSVAALRRAGKNVSVQLPRDEALAAVFQHTSWAHYLAPAEHPPSTTLDERHLPAQRFTTAEERDIIVEALLDVVKRTMRLHDEVAAALDWSLRALTDNVLAHAASDDGGIVQVSTHPTSKQVSVVVGDSGRGVRAALVDGGKGADLSHDTEALAEAIKDGTTGREGATGKGLTGAWRIATLTGGSFEITSGCAQLVMNGGKIENFERLPNQSYEGTLVTQTVFNTEAFKLSRALEILGTHDQPTDLPAIKPVDEDEAPRSSTAGAGHGEQGSRAETPREPAPGVVRSSRRGRRGALIVRLAEHEGGLTSREAAGQVREVCMGALAGDGRITLDWSGVSTVSGGFADELMGKLFVALGPTQFGNRVQSLALEGILRSLVDDAIVQRVVQTVSGHTQEAS